MPAEYDVFVSHARADGDRPHQIADALRAVGLKVWFNATEIADFESITRAVQQGVVKSKALLAWYSKTYPLRRACQSELTAAFLAAQREGDPRRRVLVVNPEAGTDHFHPIELRDAKFLTAPAAGDSAALQALADAVSKHIAPLSGPILQVSDVLRARARAQDRQIALHRLARDTAHDVNPELQALAVDVISERFESAAAHRRRKPVRCRKRPPVIVHCHFQVTFVVAVGDTGCG